MYSLSKVSMHESVKESLYTATWTIQSCHRVKYAFGCKCGTRRIEYVEQCQYNRYTGNANY